MYTYEIDPRTMFADRFEQFEKFGIPRADIERVRTAVTDMWADGPGGWVHEWSNRSIGDGRVAHFGMSFGGNFAAMSGLTGAVDAAVDLGGPVCDTFSPDHLAGLPYGIHDIIGNAMGWDHSPSLDELSQWLQALSRRGLIAQNSGSPMLVINGADDYFVLQSDTLVFEGRPDTEVHLLSGTGHCAMSRAAEVMPMIVEWLQRDRAPVVS